MSLKEIRNCFKVLGSYRVKFIDYMMKFTGLNISTSAMLY